MKKNVSRLLCMLLCAVMLWSLVPMTAWASDESDSGEAGEAVYWTLDSKGTLTISGTGEMTSAPWLTDYSTVIKKVVIEEGVTSICGSAFSGVKNLKEVDIAESVTSIGGQAFASCSMLEKLALPSRLENVGWYAFAWSTIQNLTIPETMPLAGSYHFDGTVVENLYIRDLSHWLNYVSTTTNMTYHNLYLNGELVTDLVIPDDITRISGSAFNDVTCLESVTIPESVTSVGKSAFYGCTNLKEVNLPESVTSINTQTFGKCDSLTSLTLPSSVLVVNSNAFYNNSYPYTCNLKELTFTGDAPLIAADAFNKVTATIYYSADNATWTEEIFQDYGGTLTWVADASIPGSGTGSGVKTVDGGSCGEGVDWALNSQGTITVSGSGEMTSAPWLTDYSTVIKKVVIEEGVTSICGSAFSGVKNLKEVDIAESVTSIGGQAFASCSMLEKLALPSRLENVGWYAFAWSTIQNLTIPETMPLAGSYHFDGTVVENLYIRDLSHWLNYVSTTTNMTYHNLYLNGELVTDLVIPDGITRISGSAFNDVTCLESVTIPESVTSVGKSAFYGCTNLKEVNLPESVTSINTQTFGKCDSLTSLTLPSSVLVVNSNAFYNNSYPYTCNLKELTFTGDAPLIAADAFNKVTATIYYSADNATWTEDLFQDYGGTLTWVADASIPGSGTGSGVKTVDGGSCGEGVDWALNSQGTITVSGSGEMTSAPWLTDYSTVIKKVVIEEGVTSICGSAFSGVKNLKEVDIAESVTSIGGQAFASCSMLEKLALPSRLENVGWYAFAWSTIQNLTIPETMPLAGSYHFDGTVVENLYIRDLSHWLNYVSTTTNMTYHNLYLNGELVTDLVIPDDITKISGSAFNDVTCLESVTIPESVTSVGKSAFYGCTNLKEVNLPESVTSINTQTFGKCDSLTSLTLPSSVLVVNSNAFYNNSYPYTCNLKELTFTGDAPLIAADAFNKVTATIYYSADNATWTEDLFQDYGGTLTWIPDDEIPDTGNTDTVYIIASGTCGGNVYWTLYSTGTLKVSGGAAPRSGEVSYDMDDYERPEDTPWYAYGAKITSVVVESTVDSVGSNAFAQLENLADVTIEEGVEEVGSGAFSDCENLKEITFQGSAPELGENCFENVEATIYHPTDDTTWNDDTFSGCGGTIDVVPYEKEEEKEGGIFRLAGSNRWDTAIKVADQMKENLGLEKFDAIIIASGDNFADALAGSYLSAVKSAPILLCWNGGGRFEYLNQNILDYIDANLAEDGTVYILGGKGAVPMSFDEKLGSRVNRLNGSNRFETNLMILKEAGVKSGEEILVCTSTNFADSLSASATGKPILLVFNEGGKLFENQIEYLSGLSGNTFTILGGEGAVSEKMAGLIGAYGTTTRLAGASRFETSVLVAEKYFENPDSAVLAYAWNYPDGLCGGGLAYSMNAPLILTMTKYETRGAKDYIQGQGIGNAVVLGGTGLISDDCVKNIFGTAPTTIE